MNTKMSKKRYLEGIPRPGSCVNNNGIPENLKTLYCRESCTIVEISVSARQLRCADFLSKSDPVCILSEEVDGQWKEVGMTEVISNNCNPEFVKKFYVGKLPDENKQLLFQLYDVDVHDKKPYITESNFLGQCQCSLQRLVGILTIEENLKDSKKEKHCHGKITVMAELQCEKKNQKENLNFNLKVTNVEGKKHKKHYIRISKNNEDRFLPVHRTETLADTEWKLNICILVVSNYNDQRKIRFECFEDKNGVDTCLGHFVIQMGHLKRLKERDQLKFETTTPNKRHGKPMMATIENVTTTQHPTFLDYINSGRIRLVVTFGVDFTVSNKEYHHRPRIGQATTELLPSHYARAIKMVGDSLRDYQKNPRDHQREGNIAAYGFGAVLPDGDRVSHLFALNKKPMAPECDDILDVLEHYNKTVQNVTLQGPTHFTEVIDCVCRKASRDDQDDPEQERKYHILVIFTDGEIDDTALTKDAIASASKLPVSIVIIGIGRKDFEAMKMLDADQKVIRSCQSGCAIRDIVQFVEFQEYDCYAEGAGPLKTKDSLIEEILQEIPGQFMSYMRGNETDTLDDLMSSIR